MNAISTTSQQAKRVAILTATLPENRTVWFHSFDEYLGVSVDDEKGNEICAYKIFPEGAWEKVDGE